MASNKLRILCFGDSLTSGFASFGMISHPYEEKMVEDLQVALPDLEIEPMQDGKPGDITGSFVNRLIPHFGAGQPRYDWVIILGGTNDIAYNYTPETIFENLSRCWDVALSHGSKVLALTVPEAGVKGSAVMNRATERRDKLNDLIKNAQGGNIFIHDHHAAVPFWDMSEQDRKLYWDDHVHLTPNGYDLMGKKIAERLLAIFKEQRSAEAAAAATAAATTTEQKGKSAAGSSVKTAPTGTTSRPGRRKVFKDDDKTFEEETGDSSRLGQGYVVVRKKDLD